MREAGHSPRWLYRFGLPPIDPFRDLDVAVTKQASGVFSVCIRCHLGPQVVLSEPFGDAGFLYHLCHETLPDRAEAGRRAIYRHHAGPIRWRIVDIDSDFYPGSGPVIDSPAGLLPARSPFGRPAAVLRALRRWSNIVASNGTFL